MSSPIFHEHSISCVGVVTHHTHRKTTSGGVRPDGLEVGLPLPSSGGAVPRRALRANGTAVIPSTRSTPAPDQPQVVEPPVWCGSTPQRSTMAAMRTQVNQERSSSSAARTPATGRDRRPTTSPYVGRSQ